MSHLPRRSTNNHFRAAQTRFCIAQASSTHICAGPWRCCMDRWKAELVLSGRRLGEPDGDWLCCSYHPTQHHDGDGTSPLCAGRLRARSLGPIRCLYRAIAVSTWFLLPYPVAFCHPSLPFHALRARNLGQLRSCGRARPCPANLSVRRAGCSGHAGSGDGYRPRPSLASLTPGAGRRRPAMDGAGVPRRLRKSAHRRRRRPPLVIEATFAEVHGHLGIAILLKRGLSHHFKL